MRNSLSLVAAGASDYGGAIGLGFSLKDVFVGITRFLTRFTVCALPLACTAPEDDTARAYFNADSNTATYPTLLNAPDLARANLAPAATFDENSLAARLSALRSRAAALNGPVLTNAERARLRRGVQR